jgi:2-polyprenyl-3-methyl-5-hydroxy-6-metoxy-1,4-benzoquinol methylase
MDPDEFDAIEGVLRRLEEPWLPVSPDESVHYSYVPLGLAEFLSGLEVCAANSEGRRFLDLGCGIGRSMLIAHLMGWRVTGIEHYSPYAAVARQLVPEATILECEAEEFDGYGEFDVVYSFRLCVDDDDQNALERMIVSRMRPGAVVFLGHRVLTTPIPGESLGENCWRV